MTITDLVLLVVTSTFGGLVGWLDHKLEPRYRLGSSRLGAPWSSAPEATRIVAASPAVFARSPSGHGGRSLHGLAASPGEGEIRG